MDGSYTTRATTDVVSGAVGCCFDSMPQAPFPMDMELGERTGYSTGTTTTDRSKLEEQNKLTQVLALHGFLYGQIPDETSTGWDWAGSTP